MAGVGEILATASVGAGIGLGIEHGVGYLRSQLLNRAARRTWGFLEEPTHVFVPLIRPDAQGPAAGFGDLLALSSMVEVANRHLSRSSGLKIHGRQEDFEAVKSEHLVVIGGGRHNVVYRHLIDKLQPPLHFFDTAEESFTDVRDADSSVVYSPKYDADGVVAVDKGILVRAPNPYAPAKRVIIAAGSHTYGSAAAIAYLASKEGMKLYAAHEAVACEVVVEATVDHRSLQAVQRLSPPITW